MVSELAELQHRQADWKTACYFSAEVVSLLLADKMISLQETDYECCFLLLDRESASHQSSGSQARQFYSGYLVSHLNMELDPREQSAFGLVLVLANSTLGW
ncbi:Hypothetical protein POVR2_LOCUS171 [uncultured virus]|nr:Hypothetical protein POVR2_LOCUS171 [uncultured virus]